MNPTVQIRVAGEWVGIVDIRPDIRHRTVWKASDEAEIIARELETAARRIRQMFAEPTA